MNERGSRPRTGLPVPAAIMYLGETADDLGAAGKLARPRAREYQLDNQGSSTAGEGGPGLLPGSAKAVGPAARSIPPQRRQRPSRRMAGRRAIAAAARRPRRDESSPVCAGAPAIETAAGRVAAVVTEKRGRIAVPVGGIGRRRRGSPACSAAISASNCRSSKCSARSHAHRKSSTAAPGNLRPRAASSAIAKRMDGGYTGGATLGVADHRYRGRTVFSAIAAISAEYPPPLEKSCASRVGRQVSVEEWAHAAPLGLGPPASPFEGGAGARPGGRHRSCWSAPGPASPRAFSGLFADVAGGGQAGAA